MKKISAGRHNHVGVVRAEEAPGQSQIADEIGHVACRRVVGPNDAFAAQPMVAVRSIESDPQAVVLLPPGLEVAKLHEVATRGTDEHGLQWAIRRKRRPRSHINEQYSPLRRSRNPKP